MFPQDSTTLDQSKLTFFYLIINIRWISMCGRGGPYSASDKPRDRGRSLIPTGSLFFHVKDERVGPIMLCMYADVMVYIQKQYDPNTYFAHDLHPRPVCPACQPVPGLRFLFMGHIHLFYLPHIAALGGTSGFSPLCTSNRLCGLWPFQYTPDPVNIPGTDPSGQCPGSICLVLLLRPSVSFHLQRP